MHLNFQDFHFFEGNGNQPTIVGGLYTVDGSEILHQLRLVVYSIIYKVLYISGGG